MTTGYKIGKDDSAYYLTFQVVGWVDLFTRQVYRDIDVESIKYCSAEAIASVESILAGFACKRKGAVVPSNLKNY